ncbi:AAA family ATPase [Burkholderia sp. Ac-20365]|uniref:trifunctional serine/threonine-protein kinase/ATP-binding protein/sensor histidine kinase n=1 Tax=Burkholderia sp. Ac-20365 TaxID=2703897 RepID=UPI00197C795D|nr:AAA family ATPase [Burkholderia sp. Ac-20365]MBN3759330.1 AAA family ATPase [Burkholderia sp. Ac-20365]
MDFTGFQLELLHDDGDLSLCRATRPDTPVSLLALVAARPASQSVTRLEREYQLASLLDSRWAAQPVALDLGRVPPMLLLDDDGGNPLARLLGRPLELGRCLRIAANLARALGQMHGRGLIHKDIKPANVLVDGDDSVRLTGFGIASQLPHEHQSPAPPEIIAGTFAYMAPEQTGRMNRSIDARSDLYSFGVTLYEMLTGALPFTAADAMEWIHCHIARRPAPPDERVSGIPAPVAQIVLKLLAKTAENRYQTAAGVEADLRSCAAQWDLSADIAPFTPGARDASDRLLIPEKLYGREAQIAGIVAAFNGIVAGGPAGLVLISGYSGIGKSSVVNELHKVLVPPRGLFASGKFDQYKRDIPYVPLAQAFQSLVRDLLSKSDAEIEPWRRVLLDALAPNGQLIVNLIPELALIIGEQPGVPALPPQETQNRFQIVFRRFLGVFAQHAHPLALFIDDLQWLDTATLDLLEHLVTHPDVKHVLLVGAYRDNEVDDAHPLARTLRAIERAGGNVHRIELAPLMPASVAQLVADALHCPTALAAPLAQLVHEKTGGNPFFVIQFLTTLADESLLVFDRDVSHWTWDLPRIRAKGFTENVADLMAARLTRLPEATREALGQLASLGNAADFATLTLVHGEPEASIHARLWLAVQAGLVFRQDGAYAFAHDRVQEAAYALIPLEKRAATHARIGRALALRAAPEALEESIFDIVNHLNRGVALIDTDEERERTVALNLIAGRRAMRSTAYASARGYLAQGVALLSPDAWTQRYESTFDLYLAYSECEYLAGDYTEADALLDMLLARARSNLDRAKVFILRMSLYQVAGRFAESFDAARLALRDFGVLLPDDERDLAPAADAVLQQIPERLAGRAIAELVDAPVADDPSIRTVVDLLVEAMPCAFVARPAYYPLITLTAVVLSLQHGNTDKSSFAYGNYALMLVSSLGDIPSAVQFSDMSLRLNEKFDNRRFYGKLLHLHGNHVNFWRRHIVTDLPILERASVACLEVGDLVFAGYLAFTTVWQIIEKGSALDEIQPLSEKHAALARQSHNDAILETIRLEQQFVASLRGVTTDPLKLGDTVFDDAASFDTIEKANFGCGIVFYHVMKLILAYFDGRFADASNAAREAATMLAAAMALPIEPTFHFFDALTLAARYPAATNDEQHAWRSLLAEKLTKFETWSTHCPENFRHRHALLAAEVARIEGRDADAMRFYEQAIRAAREHGFIQYQALAYELAAQFHAARGLETVADTYLFNARSCYERWGAKGKARQLARTYAQLRHDSTSLEGTIATSNEQLDLATVVNVSRAIFSGIDLNELIHTLMVLALEHAGANRGLLIFRRGDELRIEAEASTVHDGVDVRMPKIRATADSLPESVLRYVIRTGDSVLLDDASARSPFSADEYVRRHDCRSILCLPLVKQTRLIGVLYLENNLTSDAFTPARTAMLRLLASQAALSLETARLYADLQDAEALLADAQQLSQTGSFDWQVSGGELIWSKESFRIFGYPHGAAPTIEMMFSRVHPDDVTFVRLAFDRATRDRQPFDIEHRLQMPDGSIRHLQIVAHVVVDSQSRLRVLGALKDITVRKQAHDALERSEHRYRSLFFDMPVGLWQIEAQPLIALLTDLRAQGVEDLSAYIDAHPGWLDRAMEMLIVEEVNHHAAQMFGAKDRSALLGPLPWVWRESPGTFRRALESRYSGEAIFQETTKLPTLDGRIIDVLFTVARPNSAEDLGIALISLVDLTERVRAQDMLQRLQADFAHAARISMLGELTASVAHELNQPLSAIAMNSSIGNRWLDRPVPDVAEARHINVRIAADARRAVDIVDRIRGMALRRTPKRAVAQLDELTDEALIFLTHELQSRGVIVLRQRAAVAPMVLADRIQLQQVIVNLLVNAMQAMEQAGSPERKITIRTETCADGTVLCATEDSGPGIPPEALNRLFQSFYTTKENGMGMGLPICRSIIEAHGGRIAADNNSVHGGARFHFRLPSAADGS